MDQQPPIQGAMQTLQEDEAQTAQLNEQKRKQLLAQFESAPPLNQQSQQAVAGATQQAGQSTQQPTAADYAGMCQKFAEQATYGKTGIFPSAAAAFEAYSKAGQTINAQEAQPGDLIYFKPDQTNQYAGHVGILRGDGNMESATYSGVKTSNIENWIKATKQQIAGIVKP